MQSISRRQFVISAAAAGAAFGLDGPLAFIQPAGAQAAKGMSPMGSPQALLDKGFAKFKVGSIEVPSFTTAPGKRRTIRVSSRMPPSMTPRPRSRPPR